MVLVVTLSITWNVFEAMPHIEDEFAHYYQAQVFASGRLYAPSPAQPDSFLVPFTIDMEGRRFSKYPPGFAAVLAPGVAVGAHWLVNPLLGALLLWVLYVTGRDLFNVETGVLAAWLGLLSPMFLGLASSLLPHSLAAVGLLIFTWACFKILDFRSLLDEPAASPLPRPEVNTRSPSHPTPYLARSTRYALAGGFALGWAALTRPYTALAYALPFVALAVWHVTHKRSWRPVVLMGLTGVAIAALLPLYGYALTGRYTIELYTLVWPYDRPGFGPGYGILPGGHNLTIALFNAYMDLLDLLTMLLGWPLLSWLPVLLGVLLPPRRARWGLLLPLVALVLAHMAYWVQGSGLYGPRYYYEALPLLWLLAAHGLLKAWYMLKNRTGLVRAALAIMVAANVLGVLPARLAVWHGLYGVTRQPRQQMAQLGLHNALVFVHIRHWSDYSELAWTNDPSLAGDVIFVLDEGPTANAAVIAAYPNRHVFYLTDHTLVEASTGHKK